MPTVLERSTAMKEPPKYLSVKQVAKQLGVSSRTIYRMIDSDEIPAYYIRGMWRIEEEEFKAWMTKRRNQAS